ncbi:DUF1801 domain-containing protein [uncultured Zobellia sp.]|uniref:DUF1801 domain-containing protein n=1 Tax=uncultured Zobellia sp. TaxID=255433 RepID=UPI0025981D5E|nr:DUF1801 domain-containing protein [uncultured Zobellia sp.]
MNPKVDEFLNGLGRWQEELKRLHELILDCGLAEDFKWNHPCYTYKGKNIVLIHGFKNYCALLFNKGALLQDTAQILIQQTEHTRSARQIRFTNVVEIENQKTIIKQYILEAVEVEKLGLKLKVKKVTDFETPDELIEKFKENPEFEKAFKKLTPGRQKGYLLHFSKAKQATTRIARIEKNTDRIFEGYGLNDCTCGRSKRMPNCDGSHKN